MSGSESKSATGKEHPMLNRRQFLAGAASAAALLQTTRIPLALAAEPTVLRLERRTIEVNGKPASVYGIRQPNGTLGITMDVSQPFRVRVENGIEEPSLIHWHGLTPPWQQDGVPGVSGPPIPAGGTADYDFPLKVGGTYWMHSHQGLQEQLLMSAPLILRDARDRRDEQEVVLMLSDFTFKSPEEVFQGLRESSMAPMAMPAAGATPAPAAMPPDGAMAGNAMPAPAPAAAAMDGMDVGGAAAAPDLNDVEYDAFLANYRTLADPEVVRVEPGGRVLLRIIDASAMSSFTIDLGALEGELVAVDGMPVEPVRGSRFPLSTAQRLDIRVSLPAQHAAYPVLALLEGERKQTGLILAAGRADIRRIPDLAEAASPALTLDLERRLRAIRPLAARAADRTHLVDLTGAMQGYVWSLNGLTYGKDKPLEVKAGERVEIAMVNKTPMPHPMHLHGHSFQVVQIDEGPRFPGALRDSVLVPPGRRVVVAFDADNPGHWAFHCHLLYHLDSGMMTTVRYV
jgi:FtsP/CotA-like multicopper oxidase with cupredoxin domain